MIRRPPRSTQGVSSAASDVYKRQVHIHTCICTTLRKSACQIQDAGLRTMLNVYVNDGTWRSIYCTYSRLEPRNRMKIGSGGSGRRRFRLRGSALVDVVCHRPRAPARSGPGWWLHPRGASNKALMARRCPGAGSFQGAEIRTLRMLLQPRKLALQ